MSKVLILGAGASHGHYRKTDHPKPPKANDFFSAELLSKLNGRYDLVLDYVKAWTGFDLSNPSESDIERVVGEIEPIWRLGVAGSEQDQLELRAARWGELYKYFSATEMLRTFIVHVLVLTTAWLETAQCPAHQYIAEKWLEDGDTVISFNYDLIMDCALLASKRWHPRDGYGWWAESMALALITGNLGRAYRDHPAFEVYREELLTEPREKIRLLKPHGSLNWFRGAERPDPDQHFPLSTVSDPFGSNPLGQSRSQPLANLKMTDAIFVEPPQLIMNQLAAAFGVTEGPLYASFGENQDDRDSWRLGPDLLSATQRLMLVSPKIGLLSTQSVGYYRHYEDGHLPLMILPTPYKPFDELGYGQLSKVWKLTRRALETCDEIFACGFSFRDPHFRHLMIDVSFARERPLKLIIITKEKGAFEEIEKLFQLAKDTVKLEPFWGWLGEYVADCRERQI